MADTALLHRPFASVLVANRGEIACRLVRAVQAAGLRAVAIHSEVDGDALHCRLADAAVAIGGETAAESYLNIDAILQAARRGGAEAVHPGYGFLAENDAFARACLEADLVWIGPSPEAIRLMGNKSTARAMMQQRGIPCTPGYQGEDQSPQRLREEALKIGMPVMVKAAAGGGGRGMRLVQDPEELDNAIESAASEAASSFGSGELIIEKAVLGARHIEVQVLGDSQGTLVHLGERDCSVQRRNQKVLEEAPSPALDEELRQRICQAGVEVAGAIGYCNAGTVEFLFDSASREFYFLEMNTRLQVEHPVTELVTGLDLAQLQLAVAAGEHLPFAQEDVEAFGHAVEARVYAEDPARGFLPRTGPVDLWREPGGEGVRVDHGLTEGSEVSPFYDPMLAKVIAWGENRRQACARLARALDETRLAPLTTNLPFLRRALRHPEFADGSADTSFVQARLDELAPERVEVGARELALAALLLYHRDREAMAAVAVAHRDELANWRSSGNLTTSYRYDTGAGEFDVRLQALSGRKDSYSALVAPAEGAEASGGGNDMSADAQTFALQVLQMDEAEARVRVDGLTERVLFRHLDEHSLRLRVGPDEVDLTNLLGRAGLAEGSEGGNQLTAPMHGKLAKLAVAVGDQVKEGQVVAVVEAMKMEHQVESGRDGVVAALHAAEGEQVDAGSLLVELADEGESIPR